jgi:hypothetical protein
MYQLNEAHSLFQGEDADKRGPALPGPIGEYGCGYFSGEKAIGFR